eukprot:6462157-Amphidinium_carterae.1
MSSTPAGTQRGSLQSRSSLGSLHAQAFTCAFEHKRAQVAQKHMKGIPHTNAVPTVLQRSYS